MREVQFFPKKYSKFVLVIFIIFAVSVELSFLSVKALTNNTDVMVTLKLELDGSLPSCERIVVANHERSIDCHDAFFNDGPFLDRHTFNFTIPQNDSKNDPVYNICLFGMSEEKAIACSEVRKEGNTNSITESIFNFTPNGTEIDTGSNLTKNQYSSEFTLNVVFVKEKNEPCIDFDIYINHPNIVENKTHISCDIAYYSTTPYNQIYTVEKNVPADIIKEDEVFEVCIEYSYGRTCELTRNDIGDSSEYVVFDLNRIT